MKFIRQKMRAASSKGGKENEDDRQQREVLRFNSANLHKRAKRSKIREIRVSLNEPVKSAASHTSSEKMQPSYPTSPSPIVLTSKNGKPKLAEH